MKGMRAIGNRFLATICRCLAVSILQIALIDIVQIRADEAPTTTLVQRVRDEAPIGWGKLKDAVSTVEGQATIKETSIDGKGDARLRHIDFKMNQSSFVFIDTTRGSTGQPSPSSAGGRNLKYSFSLSRYADNEKWKLLQVGTEEPSNPYVLAREVGFLRYIEAPWTIVGQDLTLAMKNGKCQLLEAHESAEGRVKVVFDMAFPLENQPPNPGNRATSVTVKGGSAVLNPASFWRIENYDLVAEVALGKNPAFTFQSTGHCEYGRLGPDDFPVIKKVTYRRASLDGKDGTLSECEIDKLEVRDVLPSELLLTAFGLPEVTHTDAPMPPGTLEGGAKIDQKEARSEFPWFVVGNAVALVAIVTIFLVRRAVIRRVS